MYAIKKILKCRGIHCLFSFSCDGLISSERHVKVHEVKCITMSPIFALIHERQKEVPSVLLLDLILLVKRVKCCT